MGKATIPLLALACLMGLAGCAGEGSSSQQQEFKVLNGALTDGDIRVDDVLLADPYDFIGTRASSATVKLTTQGFPGQLRVYDVEGNIIQQTTTTGETEGRIDFPVMATQFYKIMVTGATQADQGTYRLEYSTEVTLNSQIKDGS